MRANQSPIVITGAALVTPLGLSRAATWDAVLAGRCGLGPLTALEQPLPPGSTGGQAPDLPDDFEPSLPREVRYLRRTILDALDDAGLSQSLPYAADRCGFMIGTTLHGMRAAGRYLRHNDLGQLKDFLAGATLAGAIKGLGLTGFNATTCSACSSSLGSIALGVSLLRARKLDLIVAGGYDTQSEYVYGGFNSLRLVAPGPLRPFTRGRQGMKLSEGYGIVVLERAEDAASRDKHALAAILGYGESADAHHLTQPHPLGEGAARAITSALLSAGLTPADIDLIAAHATGTPDNDAGEFAAFSSIFGADLPRVPVVAFKSHLGHTLGGAGAVELVLAALALRDGLIPGCANVRPEDIEFPGLSVTSGPARPATLRATLNTSLGFGGANTCMILGPAPASVTPPATSQRNLKFREVHVPEQPASEVFISGIGVVLPGRIGNAAFTGALMSPRSQEIAIDSGPIDESQLAHLLNARRVRRVSDYVKLSLAATTLAFQDAGISDVPAFAAHCAAVLGTTHGSTNYCQAYYGQIVEEGLAAANPMLFAEGVPNAAAAHMSLMLSLKGPCQTVIGTRTAGLDALSLAATRIAGGEWDRAVVGAAEEYSNVINAAYERWGLYTTGKSAKRRSGEGGFSVGYGAITLVLESAKSLKARGAAPIARVLRASGPVQIPASRTQRPESIIRALDDCRLTIGSTNRTWLDRAERLALRACATTIVPGIVGIVAETFSVTPLANLAAFLLCDTFPAAPQKGGVDNHGADRIGLICADYTRLVSTASIELLQRRNEL